VSAFEGRVVLVTGASAGIGEALAREAARRGADVALLARRADRLEALAAEIRNLGRRALPLPCDVTANGDLEAAVARTRSELGRIDVVVANAGFGVHGKVARHTLDDYRRQFETNVFGVLRTVLATLDELKASRGVLAIVGSVSGYVAVPGTSAYSMSKAAVHALADCLYHELRRDGVGVTLVVPGFVDSEIRLVDSQGVLHPDAPDPIPSWVRMPTERAARQILRAVARRRREVVITGHGKLFVLLRRHLPGTVAFLIRRLAVRGRPDPKRP
jgi:short-subunit dehydrogenase